VLPSSRLWAAAQTGFQADGEDRCRAHVHETFLLHGTRKETLLNLLKHGLNERYAGNNAGALFGQGTYFAEDIEKIDQYTNQPDVSYGQLVDTRGDYSEDIEELHSYLYEDADSHPGDVCYVLVCRVALGYSIRTQNRVPPQLAAKVGNRQCRAMDGKDASTSEYVFATGAAKELVKIPWQGRELFPYHSLIAEMGGAPPSNVARFREFVSFDAKNYVYPEYIVAYKRVRKGGVTNTVREPEPEADMEPEPEQA
jgi:hypothetical protein